MINQVFLTLPVADLQRSIEFFKALGFTYNPQFSDDTAACIVISGAISVMLPSALSLRFASSASFNASAQAGPVSFLR